MEPQQDETYQKFTPVEEMGELGEVIEVEDLDDIEVQVIDDDSEPAPEPVAKEVLEDDDPSIQDIEAELSPELMEKLGLSKSVKERLNKLVWQRSEERRQRESAERMQTEAIRFAEIQQKENARLKSLLQRGEEVMVTEVRSRTKADLGAAEELYKRAVEDGDSDLVLNAQKALNRAQIESHQAEMYQPVVQDQQAIQETFQPAPVQQAPVDNSQDPRLVTWMDKNKTWFKKDYAMTEAAAKIHNELTNVHRVNPASDEYYNQLDMRLAQQFPNIENIKSQVKPSEGVNTVQEVRGSGEPAATPVPTVVASSTGRQAGGAPKRQSRIVQLTPTQKDIAIKLGLKPEQYARQLLKENKNG